MGWMLVTTTRPRLAVSCMMLSINRPSPTPMVQMTLSAFLPQVTSLISGVASSMLAAVWVAPNLVAISSLKGTGSMAKMRSAPARRAPWMAEAPIPPMPITTTSSPGRTSAA